jgi:hypothetical protein
MSEVNMEHNSKLDDLARQIPVPVLPDRTWKAVEDDIRRFKANPLGDTYRKLDISFWNGPGIKLVMASLLIVVSVSVWYFMQVPVDPMEMQDFAEQSELLESADEDLDMAIYYYERAIEKLEQTASPSHSDLSPELAALYSEKIQTLKTSIRECKDALEYNHTHSRVRDQLFVSYIELRSTLQQLQHPILSPQL